MNGKTKIVFDSDSDKIKITGRSIHGITYVDIITVDGCRFYEFTKEQALQLIEAIQTAIKEVD